MIETGERRGLVTVIDDNEGARASLRALLESAGFDVAVYVSGSVFLQDIFPPSADCMVVDVRMPGLNGLELQEELARRDVTTPLIMVTGHGDVPLAVRAIRAGAFDFLEKPYEAEALLDSVGRAIEKNRGIQKLKMEAEAAGALLARLSARERSVMDSLALGHSNKSIAHSLGISPRTVEVHRSNVLRKMESRNVADLVKILRIARVN